MLIASVLFVPWMVLPGFVLGRLLKLWDFRSLSAITQLAASMVLSVSIVPILVFLLWTQSFALVEVLYYGLIGGTVILLLAARGEVARWRLPRSLVWIALGWCAVAVFTLVDLPIGSGLCPTQLSLDHSFRTEFVAAVARAQTLPPASPFFLDAGHPVPFRYHYFWFMLCGAVVRLSGFSLGARDALFGSILWAGLAGIALLGLYLKIFFAHKDAVRRGLILLGCMCVGGLQFLPFLVVTCVRLLHGKPALFWPTLTWIDLDGQMPGWYDTFVWVPNHTAGFVAGMTALLLLWKARVVRGWRQAWLPSALAGLALASSVGLSIHLAFAFFAFFGVFAAVLLGTRRWTYLARVLLALAVAGATALPYVLLLLHASSGVGAGGDRFVHLAVRSSIFGEWLSRGLHAHGVAEGLIALLVQPLVWVFELGFLVVAGMWKWRHFRAGDADARRRRQLLTLLGGVMLLVTLLLSSGTGTAGTNDLGWRGTLPIQAILLWCAVDYFASGAYRQRGALRILMLVLVVLGVGSTLAEVGTLRLFALAVDHGEAPHVNPLVTLQSGNGAYIADVRQALEFVRRTTPISAVVQDNPAVNDGIVPGLFMERQTAARGETGYRFGGKVADYPAVLGAVERIFDRPMSSFASVERSCRALGINDLLVTSSDPVWTDQDSWVWTEGPAFANAHARIFACSAPIEPASE